MHTRDCAAPYKKFMMYLGKKGIDKVYDLHKAVHNTRWSLIPIPCSSDQEGFAVSFGDSAGPSQRYRMGLGVGDE